MCDTTQKTGLNLSASASRCWIWAGAQILNGPIRVEDETTLQAVVVVDPITSLWGKPRRRILKQIFRSLRAFRPAKHTYLEWNLLDFAIRDFSFFFWESDLWSDVWPTIDGVVSLLTAVSHDEAKMKDLPVALRETRKRIASFKETKYDFSL